MSKFRFHIDGQQVTEWHEEPVAASAVVVASALRQQFPEAALRIERDYYIAPQQESRVQFVLTEKSPAGATETRLSKLFAESESEAALLRIRAEFPNAQIERVMR